jgi:hypothetical protein
LRYWGIQVLPQIHHRNGQWHVQSGMEARGHSPGQSIAGDREGACAPKHAPMLLDHQGPSYMLQPRSKIGMNTKDEMWLHVVRRVDATSLEGPCVVGKGRLAIMRYILPAVPAKLPPRLVMLGYPKTRAPPEQP